MDKTKNALTAQMTSRQAGMMRMGGQGKSRGTGMPRAVKLILFPCLCDLRGPTNGGREPHARQRKT
jgi:hypothetical protein